MLQNSAEGISTKELTSAFFIDTITNKHGLGQLSKITATERRILAGLCLGLSAKEIARVRGCSHRTVERHIANLKKKCQTKTLSPAFVMCLFLYNLEHESLIDKDCISVLNSALDNLLQAPE
jgi:DNA-binding CsgD family transcriptional regulator